MAKDYKKICFLYGHGACGGGITREHYISRSVLNQLSPDGKSVNVVGPTWVEGEDTFIGISALQSKILCGAHNSGLTDLDSEAQRFFSILHDVDKSPETVSETNQFNGHLIERWFIKALCGLVVTQKWGGGNLPGSWKNGLMGNTLCEPKGIYFASPSELIEASSIVSFHSLKNESTGKIVGAQISFAGIPINLGLHRPTEAFGRYRPDCLQFNIDSGKREVLLHWDLPTGNKMQYNRIGTRGELGI